MNAIYHKQEATQVGEPSELLERRGDLRVRRVNRMAVAIADRVAEFVEALVGVRPEDAYSVAELPARGLDLLVVGHRHVMTTREDEVRHGHTVLDELRGNVLPRVIIYVVPAPIDHPAYAKDRAALTAVAEVGTVYVLEFPRLRELGRVDAVALARITLTSEPSRVEQMPLLLPRKKGG